MGYNKIPDSIKELMETVTKKCENHPRWAEIFNNCFANTITTTIKPQQDGTTFVLTGDIPAMWLRDSTAQVRPYLLVADKDDEINKMICGLIEKQFQSIILDPYANAFNESANSAGHQDDQTQMMPNIWERKYEIDSLCYPIQLAYLLWKATGKTGHFNNTFVDGVSKILDLWEIEQNHEESLYTFMRENCVETDTLVNSGKGSPVGYTGMTWSGFRPSDDCCTYHYLVPSNMFAVVVLDYLNIINKEVLDGKLPSDRILKLRNEIDNGIKKYAVVENKSGEKIYAYEVDGLGNYVIMDDANVPSLLAAPYLGYCNNDDIIYQNTRKTILSSENPFYFSGKSTNGIGSPHTPKNYVWPIAKSIQGMTSNNKQEKQQILDNLCDIDAGTNLMHEGVYVNDPKKYTREWFSWSNMMFCELLLDYFDIKIKK